MRFVVGKDFRKRNPSIHHNSWGIELADRSTAAIGKGMDTLREKSQITHLNSFKSLIVLIVPAGCKRLFHRSSLLEPVQVLVMVLVDTREFDK